MLNWPTCAPGSPISLCPPNNQFHLAWFYVFLKSAIVDAVLAALTVPTMPEERNEWLWQWLASPFICDSERLLRKYQANKALSLSLQRLGTTITLHLKPQLGLACIHGFHSSKAISILPCLSSNCWTSLQVVTIEKIVWIVPPYSGRGMPPKMETSTVSVAVVQKPNSWTTYMLNGGAIISWDSWCDSS